eukprot:TRINITY_DN16056_c0_g1_i6.p1 TRINITY_DN16056_c0_g1~~TRINITY_DN16056_c0_g1_i6.p1  ORF type:complete len:246 (+),score=30.49 TRINITY_DN16056_c0_g1_i6:52-789(+)
MFTSLNMLACSRPYLQLPLVRMLSLIPSVMSYRVKPRSEGGGPGSFMQENATRRQGHVKALLIGFSYEGTDGELGGTIDDVLRIFSHLHVFHKYPASDITILTDAPSQVAEAKRRGAIVEDASCNGCGTVAVLRSVMEKMRRQLHAGDHFLWAFAGHGSFLDDETGDELDGRDETIVTPSFEEYRDDDFYDFLTSLPEITVSAISDACHSEGFSDLPFNSANLPKTLMTDLVITASVASDLAALS